MTKSVRVLNYGFETLDKILGVGENARDVKRIEFDYISLSFYKLSVRENPFQKLLFQLLPSMNGTTW